MDQMDLDFFVDISFLTSEEGGRKSPPIIKDVDYTYRPTIYLNGDHTIAYSCGMVISKTREVFKPHIVIKSVPIILLHPEEVIPKIKVGDKIEFAEGNHIVARGVITKINI